MNAWLLKTEPEDFSYDDLEDKGTARWDGVRNPVALRHMRNMQPGDAVFIYHTGKQKRIVGVGQVTTDAYPDPGADNPRYTAIDIMASYRLPRPVTLSEIKGDPFFSDWELARLPRLSVMPVAKEYWDAVLALSFSPSHSR